MEPNDSPEIPDRGETSDIPGLPSGASDLKEHLAKVQNISHTGFLAIYTMHSVTLLIMSSVTGKQKKTNNNRKRNA